MSTVLDQIIDGVREDLQVRRAKLSLAEIRSAAAEAVPPLAALSAFQSPAPVHVISEVKRSSPSKGALADIPDPARLALAYEAGGATAISVLTEQRRFGGALADLDAVRACVKIPVLRKDFMVDEYQFYEARAHGADLVLLIVAALDEHQLHDFYSLSRELGMLPLVEVHDEAEAERAGALGADLVGVNARNLKTLEVHPEMFSRVASVLPSGAVRVAESGVGGPQDAARYVREGADALLVGEALVKHGAPTEALRAMITACEGDKA